ncbi:MAG TPA: exopolysaccharide biosynthesis polyprenyl glycosylphosphotransferase, partial [Frankiaceae bacterium]|nr:exopolysaccharide biosynthesis polyprenyl glycosylphosphotransferase [Frankiaceae bacterium]
VASAAVPLLVLGLLAGSAAAGPLARLAAVSVAALWLGRGISAAVLRGLRRCGLLAQPVLLVGAGALAVEVAAALRAHPDLGLSPRGFLDSPTAAHPAAGPLLGGVTDLTRVVAAYRVRRLVVCFPSAPDAELVPALRACRSLRVQVDVVPRLYELGARLPAGDLDEIRGIPLVRLRRTATAPAAQTVKRALDVGVAAALLVVTAPLLAALLALVRLVDGGPALFRQMRLSGPGRLVRVLKLRTVVGDDVDSRWRVPAERCTRLGGFLRRTHLDELPQLVNVLRGEMSLVGPRPERPCFVDRFSEEIPGYADRHRMPAGITGWAQVHGLCGDTSVPERARFDNAYIENWSPWLDLVILARTATGVLPRRQVLS